MHCLPDHGYREALGDSTGVSIGEQRVDGGPTRNGHLMQFKSGLLIIPARIPDFEELSGIGPLPRRGLHAWCIMRMYSMC